MHFKYTGDVGNSINTLQYHSKQIDVSIQAFSEDARIVVDFFVGQGFLVAIDRKQGLTFYGCQLP